MCGFLITVWHPTKYIEFDMLECPDFNLYALEELKKSIIGPHSWGELRLYFLQQG